MKLNIKQKVFSWGDKFSVKDEYGNDRYYVEGEVFSLGKKLHIYNDANEEVALVRQKVFSFLPRFFVYKGETEIAEIVKEFTFFTQKYTISGLGWQVEGDFPAHNYYILDDIGNQIAYIHKQWFTWGDCYEIDIQDSADEVIALAVVLAIDCVLDANRRSNQ